MKIKVTCLLFLLNSVPTWSGVHEPLDACQRYNEPTCCCNTEQLVENTITIQNVSNEVKRYNRKFEENKNEFEANLKELEISVKNIDSRTTELSSSMWNTLDNMSNIFYGIFGLGLGVGGIIVWRENSVYKARIELEVLEVKELKSQAKSLIDESLAMISDNKIKLKNELACIRRRTEIDRLIDSGSKDFDDYYPYVTFLAQFHFAENLLSLQKINIRVPLNERDKTELSKFINRLKNSANT